MAGVPCKYANQSGTLVNATINFYDDANGVRKAVTGWTGGGTVVGPTDPPPPPPPITGARLLGVYDSGGDSASIPKLGVPMIATTYYTPGAGGTVGANNIVTTETARIRRGTVPHVTMSMTQEPGLLTAIADGVNTTFLPNYVGALDTISRVNTSIPVMATVDHEHEVKINKALLTGTDADPARYAKVMDKFAQICRTDAPLVQTMLWWGGSDSAKIKAWFDLVTETFDHVSMDPYSNAKSPYELWPASFTDRLGQLRNASGIHFANFKRCVPSGSVGLGEFGLRTGDPTNMTPPVPYWTDEQVAAYYTDLLATMETYNLHHAIFFNSARDISHLITGDGSDTDHRLLPKAVAAFAASMAEARAAAA